MEKVEISYQITPEALELFKELQISRNKIFSMLENFSELTISPNNIEQVLRILPVELKNEYEDLYKNMKLLVATGAYDGDPELAIGRAIEARLEAMIESITGFLVLNEKNLNAEDIIYSEDAISNLQNSLRKFHSLVSKTSVGDSKETELTEERSCLLVDDGAKYQPL